MSDNLFESDTLNPEEENDDTLLSVNRNTHTKCADPEVWTMYEKSIDGRLIVQPAYQRDFVWDAKKASLLSVNAIALLWGEVDLARQNHMQKQYVRHELLQTIAYRHMCCADFTSCVAKSLKADILIPLKCCI